MFKKKVPNLLLYTHIVLFDQFTFKYELTAFLLQVLHVFENHFTVELLPEMCRLSLST